MFFSKKLNPQSSGTQKKICSKNSVKSRFFRASIRNFMVFDSWCKINPSSDHDYEASSPSLALIGLNQLDLPIDGAATATAAAKAVAMAAAVSVDHNPDLDEGPEGVIYMNDARTKAASYDCSKGQQDLT